MNLRRYDIYIAYYEDEGAFLEEQERADGAYANAFDAEALEQENEALRKNNSELLDQRYELMQKVARLEEALRKIENMPVGFSHAESFYQMIHIAKDALEGK